jgi:hypothetical protein
MKVPLSKKHEVCPDYAACDDVRCLRMGFCLELKILVGRNAVEKLLATGVTKKDIRKQRKAEKKELGRRQHRLKLAMEFRREAYANLDPCIKNGNICDKQAACSILNQCCIERFAGNEDLINALRGPLVVKDIIRILAKLDPSPMRSYYFRSNGRKRESILPTED